MSGVKTVTVNQSEYQRLQAAEARLRTVQQDLPEVIAATRRQSATELQERLRPLEHRQQQFQSAMQGLSAEVREVERQTSERLRQQQQEYRQAVQISEQALRQEMGGQEERLNERIDQERTDRLRQIRRVQADLSSQIAREREARKSEIQGLQQRLNALARNEQRKSDIAASWIADGQIIRDSIEQNKRHVDLAPGKLDAWNRTLQQARSHLHEGVFEGAIVKGQDAYIGLSELRVELEQLEHEWQIWRNVALEEIRVLLELARSNRLCTVQDAEGKDLNIKVEVDWWTEGRLSRLESEITALVAAVEREDTPPSTQELRGIAETAVSELRQRLDGIVCDARTAVFGSQVRVNIAQLAVDALQEQGYSLDSTTYEGNDMRRGFAAKVRHVDGGEVVVLVDPVADPGGKNDVRILSYDEELHTDHEREQRAIEIGASLRRRGVSTGEISKAGDKPSVADRDIQQIRNRKSKARSETTSQKSVAPAQVPK